MFICLLLCKFHVSILWTTDQWIEGLIRDHMSPYCWYTLLQLPYDIADAYDINDTAEEKSSNLPFSKFDWCLSFIMVIPTLPLICTYTYYFE